jgi:hypothetical protein
MSPHGDPIYLPSILADDRLRLVPEQERVDGHPCYVLEVPLVVKLWVDVETCCLRRRDELVDHSRFGKNDYWKQAASYAMQDFREVAPGVLLPFEIHRSFASNRQSTIHVVTECSVNDVADKIFEYEPRPGDLIVDRDTDSIRQVPGGFDKFEILTSRAMGSADVGVDYEIGWSRLYPQLLLAHAAGIVAFAICVHLRAWTSILTTRRIGAAGTLRDIPESCG